MVEAPGIAHPSVLRVEEPIDNGPARAHRRGESREGHALPIHRLANLVGEDLLLGQEFGIVLDALLFEEQLERRPDVRLHDFLRSMRCLVLLVGGRRGGQLTSAWTGRPAQTPGSLDILPISENISAMPLKATDARKLVRRLLDEGKFVPPGARSHARKEMEKDGLTDVDAVNVLRGGVVKEGEFENGSWRHRVETQKMVFVVAFDPELEVMPAADDSVEDLELVVVTGWRQSR